ncbi:malate transporter [Escherichia coli]|nr:malate transporter [Escherichia coli]EFO3599270.1 malate transporter [Escherichia coli]EFO3682724.1 malate transporter [Escherichia coli]
MCCGENITFHQVAKFSVPLQCEQFFHGKKFCEACGTGIYCRAVCTKSVYSYQPDLFQDCGGAST